MTARAERLQNTEPSSDSGSAIQNHYNKIPSERTWHSQLSDKVVSLAKTALSILANETCKRQQNAPIVSEYCVNAFCSLLLAGRMRPALSFSNMFSQRGADYETIAEDLFAAAAKCMGDRWDANQISTIDLNIGTSTLVRTHIALRSSHISQRTISKSSALFGSFVGQAHTLGISLASEYFRRSGWQVIHKPGATPDVFIATASAQTPDIVGLTATTDSDVSILKDVVRRLRDLESAPQIIVGGSAPGIPSLKADAIASRLDMGLLAANRLTAGRLHDGWLSVAE